jgi:hypothetical protein
VQRYALLSVARSLLSAEGRRQGLVWGHDYHRTAKCKSIVHGNEVGVYLARAISAGNDAAFFTRLSTCGSVWSCPVCSVKIQEKRRIEIGRAVDWAYGMEPGETFKRGTGSRKNARAQPVMVTLTFPHTAKDKLGQLLKQHAHALELLRKGAPWRRFVERTGYLGLIRALELTHGRHGWHPHTHELWFVSPDADADELKDTITRHWVSACMRAGLLTEDKIEDFEAHAVDVKGWCSASDYLAKQDDPTHWGVDREMGKASTKAGRRKGRHPFALLRDSIDGDERAGRLFIEYSDVMRDQRKRQIYWSPGLKSRVGVEDKRDEQLADESAERADWLGNIDLYDWRRVLRSEQRAEVLNAAETGGWPAVQALLDALPDLPQLPGGGVAVPAVVARVSDRPFRMRIERPASLEPPDQREGDGGEREHASECEHECAEHDELLADAGVAQRVSEPVKSVEGADDFVGGRDGDGNSGLLHDCRSG